MDKGETVLHYSEPGPDHPALTASTINAPIPQSLAKLSFEDVQSLYGLDDKYPELKAIHSMEDKRAFVLSRRAELRREIEKIERDRKNANGKRSRLQKGLDVLTEVSRWVSLDLKIERPEGPSFRRMRKAVADGNTIYMDNDPESETPAYEFEKEVFRFAEVLLIEHDWAGALQSADVENAVVKLPYEVCAFEFRFSGRAVIALATQLETDIVFSPAIECGDRWLLTGGVTPTRGIIDSGDGWSWLFDTLGAQVRAACIALDAEVAKSEAVREPYTGSPGKNSYHPPKAYHVVSLAHRRARPLAAPGTETEIGRRVRLHFRRGHWRHFVDHKTWIRWMLVGDPDLGFVDKHYKL